MLRVAGLTAGPIGLKKNLWTLMGGREESKAKQIFHGQRRAL